MAAGIQKKKKQWRRLLEGRCVMPDCGSTLTSINGGMELRCSSSTCEFTITRRRAEQLKHGMVMSDFDRSHTEERNLEALNNLGMEEWRNEPEEDDVEL